MTAQILYRQRVGQSESGRKHHGLSFRSLAVDQFHQFVELALRLKHLRYVGRTHLGGVDAEFLNCRHAQHLHSALAASLLKTIGYKFGIKIEKSRKIHNQIPRTGYGCLIGKRSILVKHHPRFTHYAQRCYAAAVALDITVKNYAHLCKPLR